MIFQFTFNFNHHKENWIMLLIWGLNPRFGARGKSGVTSTPDLKLRTPCAARSRAEVAIQTKNLIPGFVARLNVLLFQANVRCLGCKIFNSTACCQIIDLIKRHFSWKFITCRTTVKFYYLRRIESFITE